MSHEVETARILFLPIVSFLKEQGMAVFKLPEKLLCLDELPHNATGKVVRREVKEILDKASAS